MNISNELELSQALSNPEIDSIELINPITVSQYYSINRALSFHGNHHLITFSKNGCLHWNTQPTGWYTFGGRAGSELAITDAPLTRGSYVLCQSNDKIQVEPHHKTGAQYPQELHLVNFIKDKTVGLDNNLVDDINGNCSIINLLDGIKVDGIRANYEGVQPNYATALKFDGVTNLEISDTHFLREGPGAIWINNGYNCHVTCRIDGTVASDNVYGLVVGTVNNVFFNNRLITGCRHAFTTTAGTSKGVARWGTPQNVVLNNCIINVPSKLELKQTRVGLDTHAEGYGITFKSCLINIGSSATNYGAFIRSRNVVFDGCTFNGQNSKGIELYGPNATVLNCTFNNLWYGVATKKIYKDYAHNALVVGSTFNNMAGPAIDFEVGTNHKVDRLTLNNVLYQPGAKFKAAKSINGQYVALS